MVFVMRVLNFALPCLYVVLFALIGLNLALGIVNTPMVYTYPSGITIQFYTSLVNGVTIMYVYTMGFALLSASYFAVKKGVI